LLTGMPSGFGRRTGGLLEAAQSRPGISSADTWVVDAGRSLIDAIVAQQAPAQIETRAVLLSNARLDNYRQNFSHEMNTMRKDLADADAVFDRLRKVKVEEIGRASCRERV